ncbi:MAG: sulfotransferase [Candidatus Loosdrechtia sp.]|uniref:sulfotransferase n=1 Tax=Candidatus Loosdrechtia sp. TaxID=3101272 RepID=UPI003A60D872|nr:MAG: sulfotransferase [Candidatus Jettenia sp. AMX2]
MNKDKKPILITGSHRSGTTWAGRMIAHSPEVAYIHEPFSVSDAPSKGICNTEFKYWFTYVTDDNDKNYYQPLKDMLAFKYNLIASLKTARNFSMVKQFWQEYRQCARYRHAGSIPLLKDPIAFFSAEWLQKKFAMNIIVLIRHPAAFVSSIKKLNWSHPFSDFLAQDLLMRNILSPFRDEITHYANSQPSIIDQGILLWRIIHHTILQYQQQHPQWFFIRHEDLSREPLTNFAKIFQYINLDMTAKIIKRIEEHSGSENLPDTDSPYTLKRNSQLNIWNWKKRLTPSEIVYIRDHVEGVSKFFYSDADW